MRQTFSDLFIPARPHCCLAILIEVVVADFAREHALDAVGAGVAHAFSVATDAPQRRGSKPYLVADALTVDAPGGHALKGRWSERQSGQARSAG